MKEKESNVKKKKRTNTYLNGNTLIELSLISSSDEEQKRKKSEKKRFNNIDDIFQPPDLDNSFATRKTTVNSMDSQSEEEDDDKAFTLLPANFFSFCLISYILIFLIFFLCSFNFSYLTLPYIGITLIICLLSNVPENYSCYYVVYLLRILIFPLVCIYSFAIIIFKIYIFSNILDDDSYAIEKKDFILNMGIFYFSDKKTYFNLIRSIGPESILFLYTLFFSFIMLLTQLNCFLELPLCFDNELKNEEKTPKKIRRRIKITYLLLLIYVYFSPSITCFSYIVMCQICLGLLSNDKRGLINKRYCMTKFFIIFMFLLFTAQMVMNNLLQINDFQIKYLIKNSEGNDIDDLFKCQYVNKIWINLGITCIFDIESTKLIFNYIGFAFSIISYISIENLIRILSNGNFVTNEDYFKDHEEKMFVDETDEVSWIVRRFKNFFLLIVNFIEQRHFISHLCRIAAIIHMNYCHNIYSFVVFLWLFLSFIRNDISSTKCFAVFILIPSIIISSLCYNLSNFNIISEDENDIRDIYTFVGLKKLNKYFYFSFISCHIFFLLIITLLSSLEDKYQTVDLKTIKTNRIDNEKISKCKTGMLSDISLLNVDSLIGMNTINRRKTKATKAQNEESAFENKFKNLLQKNIQTNYDENDKKNKDENLTIFNILVKKFFKHINKINLIIVYLVCVSSINIVHLLLVFLFIVNVLSSIINAKVNKRNLEAGNKKESKIQYFVTKITLSIIQMSFLFEFLVDIYKCFHVYSKSDEEKKHITVIMQFILNYKEAINESSCETLLFIIVYFYYFEYQIYLIKNKKTKYKDLEVLLNNPNITFHLYFKNNLKFGFFIYDYFMKILNHIFIWIYTFLFIFFLCYFELNILFSIQLLLFLISIYLLLQKIQTNIKDNNTSVNRNKSNYKDIATTYIFLIFSVANTFIVYLYQFIRHDFFYNRIKDTFLVGEKLSYIGLKKYSDKLYIKLLPFFVINFISILFLNELDNFQKRIEQESIFFNNIGSNNENDKQKTDLFIVNNNEDYTELYENCKNEIINIKLKLFGANFILIITKIYWIFLFLVIAIVFNYFSLSTLVYIIIFGITFISMFKEIITKVYNYSANDNNSEDSSKILDRININRNHREFSFRLLVGFSFLIFYLYYIYGIFDISISYCNPKLWINCDNEDNIIDTDNNDKNNESYSIGLIKSISFIFGVYYDTKRKGILSVGWVHLFLCILVCFDVYVQKLEHYFNNIKTEIIIKLDEKTLDSVLLRQKSLESQVDALISPNKKVQKNIIDNSMSGTLREEIGKKLVGNLSEIIKIFNLYKMNLQRNKDLKKIMLSIKCIFEEIIILTLVIEGIMKVNLWSLIYFIYIFYLVFTKNTIKKFYYFYCFIIIGIIIQISLFIVNTQQFMLPKDTDEEVFTLIEKYLGIPWTKSNNIFLNFIFGIGVDKNQTDTIYYDFFLIVIIYIYLDNFSYTEYNENDSNNKMLIPFAKGNILYDAMVDNPSLINREIDINKKEFGEIKRIVKKNTFIGDVNSIRYDDFLRALRKLKILQVKKKEIGKTEIKNDIISQRQKLLIELNSKTQQLFSLFDFIKIIIYLSSHNFVLMINIVISMMIPGIISLIYIIIFIVFLFKSNSLIQGKRYNYPHFTRYIRIILIIDISLQLFFQFFIGKGLVSQILRIVGVNKLIEFKDDEAIKNQENFSFLVAKAISFFFINLQILIYSSIDFIEYYFVYLLTLRVNQYKTSKINAFKFNNERIKVMTKSLALKEEATNTMNELQYLLQDWRSIFSKGKKKQSIKRISALRFVNKEELSTYVNEEEAKKTIKDWIMDKFLISIYTYIHKYSSPYQNLGKNEIYELEKNIIQGETTPITYIEFLIDFYLEALSPFQLTEQGLSIVESIINGTRDERKSEIDKIKKMKEKEKEERAKENENLKKKYMELVNNVNRIDSAIQELKTGIRKEKEEEFEIKLDADEEEEVNNSLPMLDTLITSKEVKKPEKSNERTNSIFSRKEEEEEDVYPSIDKDKLLMYYEKAKKIIEEEEVKIDKKIKKYEENCLREEKHNKNKYLDDEIETDGKIKEINKIDLNDEKFLKFEILKKKSILFTRYLTNSFIFSCILLDLKSCLTYNFHWFCYILMIINHMYSSSLISSFYPLSIFCYALLEYPRPVRTYWKICLYYTFIILFIKLLFTLTFFMDDDPFKGLLETLNDYKIGFKYCSSTLDKEFFKYIIFDISVIVSLMIYINILLINGAWNKREQEIESIYAAMERVSISNCVEVDGDEIKDFNKEFLSSNRIKENLAKIIKEESNHRRRGKVSLMDDIFKNKIKTGKINKEEKREKFKLLQDEEENNENNKEIKKSYFERLFPKNRNEKPGREFYPIYTSAMIVILAYILIFFNYMVRDENYGSLDLDVQQFNGLMVIYFIIHVIILICDRAILLFQSQKNPRFKYYLYNKTDFNNLQNIIDFRKKTKDEKKEYFKKNLFEVEDELIELYPKKKRWANNSLVIPIQHFAELRDKYYISFKQKETFNKPLFYKYLLYIFIVLFIHFITFVYFPMRGNVNLGNEVFCTEGEDKCNDFRTNKSLIFFYILYLFYLIPSASQIKYGFHDMKKKSILKRNPSGANNILVTIFQKIPFLNEIKNILDWTLTSTSLDLSQWIQFESIYETIFSTYSDGGDDGVIGQKIEKSTKVTNGGVLSFILIFSLIFPLVIFSSINPTNTINPVNDAKLKVDLCFTYLDKEIKKYTLFENNRPEAITEINDEIFSEYNYTESVKTRNFPKEQIQIIKFYETSDTNWDLVLPHIQSIVNELNITNEENKISSIDLIIQTQFTRSLPAEAQIIIDEITANIYDINEDNSTSEGALKAYNLSNSFTNCLDTYIDFYDIYTPVRKLSGAAEPMIIEDSKHFSNLGIQLGFQGCDNSTGKNNFLQSYFTLKIIKKKDNATIINEPLSFHIFSETISPTTSSYSVYAFYTAVILVFGEYVRDFCSGEPEKIMLNEMPDPKKMVDLCEGITIARNSADYRMEKKLYYILIELLREPSYLKEITKSSVEDFEEKEENAKFITTDDFD